MTNLLPLTWRGLSRPRIVSTFHDLLTPYLFPKAGPLRRLANGALVAGSDGVVVTNRDDFQRLASARLVKPKHLVEIPIGSNIDCRPPPLFSRAALRRALGVADTEVLLGYFGLMHPSKGFGELLEALSLLVSAGRPAKLLVIGGGEGSADRASLAEFSGNREAIDRLRLASRVTQTGYLEPAEVSAHLLACDVGVQPYRDGVSLRRGSTMAMLAHGVPLVTTRAGSSPLQDGVEALLVPPLDPPALAAAIERLINDVSLAGALGRAAKLRAAEFSWSRIAGEFIAFYRSVLSS